MAKITPFLVTNFAQGEVSDFIDARPDVAKRYNGARTVENFWILPEGGVTRRSGSMVLTEIKDSTKFTRLVPFKYSTSDAFVLIAGDQNLWFVKNRAVVLDGAVPYEIVTPFLEADLRDLHHEQSADYMFFCSLNSSYDIQKLIRLADDDWVISDFNAQPPPSFEADQTFAVDAAVSANTGAIKIRSNGDQFLAGDVGRQFVAGAGRASITALDSARQLSATVLDPFSATITAGPNTLASVGTTVTSTAHGVVATNYILLTAGAQAGEFRRVASVTTPDVFEIDNAFSADQAAPVAWNKRAAFVAGAWALRLSPQVTLDVNAKEPVGLAIGLTFGAAAFRSTDVGEFIKVYGGTILVTEYINSTTGIGVIQSVLDEAVDANPAVAPAGSWTLEEASWSAARGRPRTLCIDSGRLDFASTIAQPTTVWGSSVTDIYNFATGSLHENAFEHTLQGGPQNPIQWLVSHLALYLGTTEKEFRAKGEGAEVAISGNEPPHIVPINFAGSRHIQPLVVDNAIVFAQFFGQDLVILSYSLEQSSDATALVGQEPNLFSRHIGDMGFAQHQPCYAQKPYSILFWLLDNGQVANFTFKPRQEVNAFSRTVTDGVIESMATVPHENGRRVMIFQIVRRVINGVTRRFVEYYEDDHPDLQNRISDGVRWSGLQTDAGKAGSLAAGATTITVFWLPNTTVDVIIGDHSIGQKLTDASGVVTLEGEEIPEADTFYEVGLHFTSTLTTLTPAIAGEVTEGLTRSIPITFARVKNTIGGKVNGKPLKRQEHGARMFTGRLKMENLETADPYDGAVTITQDEPYPMTVLNLAMKVAFGDDYK